MVATSPRVAETNRRAVAVLAAEPSIVVFRPGTSTATLFAVDKLPLSSTKRRPAGVEGEDLAVDALTAACRVVDLTEQAAIERDRVPDRCRIDDRLRDVDAVGGDAHVPGHPVGVADLLREFGDQSLALRWGHGGDLFADAVLAHRRPSRHHVGRLNRPRPGGHRRGGAGDRR